MSRTLPAVLIGLAVLVGAVGLLALPAFGAPGVDAGSLSDIDRPATATATGSDGDADLTDAVEYRRTADAEEYEGMADAEEYEGMADAGEYGEPADSGNRAGGQPDTVRADPSNVTLGSPIRLQDGETESGTGTVGADAGIVTASGLAAIDAKYNQELLDERLESASTEAAQRSAVRTQQDRVQRRVIALRNAEAAAYREYQSGNLDEAELAYELARIHGTAVSYHEWVRHTERRTDETPGISPDDRLGALVVDTLIMQGPVRERTVRAADGASARKRVYVTTSTNGLVLGANDDGQYVREAYDRERYQRNADITIDEVEALERVDEQYPWVAEFDDVTISRNFQTPSIDGGAYVVEIQHPHGTLRTYVNTESGDAFREHQFLDHESLPTEEAANGTADGLRLIVERTYSTGPAKVTLLDDTADEPLQGSVSLNNQTIGTTDGNGVVWIALPPGQWEVSGTVGLNNVTVTVGDPQTTPEQDGDEETDG